jgi:hypothetical protein
VTDTQAVVVNDRRVRLPAAYVAAPPEFPQVQVSAIHSRFPAWATPATLISDAPPADGRWSVSNACPTRRFSRDRLSTRSEDEAD